MTEPVSPSFDERVKRWNHLRTVRKDFQLESIRIIESSVLSPQLIELDRVIAFVGLHGSGKSLILRMIEAAFGYEASVYTPPFLPRDYAPRSTVPQLSGILDVSLKTPSGTVTRTIDLRQPGKDRLAAWPSDVRDSFGAWYIDPLLAFVWLNYMYDNFDFTSKIKRSDHERHLSKPDIRALRNILGRDYDSVTIRSALIEDGTDDELILPSVVAKLGAKTFDNTAMSQAELWVHYVSWFLKEKIDKGGLALIDEPEAFIAARGRRPFIDYVCHQALRRDLQLIIGTHSPEILSRFPLANIRMCVSGEDGIQIIKPESLFQIHESIGIETSVKGIVLVEDKFAEQVLSALFARYDTALTREIDIIPVNGASNVTAGVKLHENANRLSCIGVLDGNERHNPIDLPENYARSILFLPGEKSPEDEVLTSALMHASQIAETTGTRADNIIAAISSCQDLDHQYRIGAIARQLGYPEVVLTSVLVQAWLRQPMVAQQAEHLATEIRRRLRTRL